MPADENADAPGWAAIEARAGAFVTPQEPLHWATGNLPGQDGIYGLSAYRAGENWLLVTFGLSELFGKVSGNPESSGWGFELTMRVPAAGEAAGQPPGWALNLLQQLGAYVFASGRRFGAGHRMQPGGPITGTPGTRLTAIAFATDPELGTIATPNGQVEFLEVIGITDDELARMQATSTASVLAELAGASPLFVTDVTR